MGRLTRAREFELLLKTVVITLYRGKSRPVKSTTLVTASKMEMEMEMVTFEAIILQQLESHYFDASLRLDSLTSISNDESGRSAVAML